MSETPNLPPAYRLVALDKTDSTNAQARRLAREGAEDGTCVWAREQTAGRGRRGRTWISPPGNLYFSLILRPECPPARSAELGFVAALALGDALGTLVPPLTDLQFKWPNDVLLNDAKVAGFLLESSASASAELDWLVLGMGVNVLQFPTDTEYPATSLAAVGCVDVNEIVVLEAFTRAFLSWVNRWLDEGFPPVRRGWLNYARGRGEPIVVRLENEMLEGTFEDLDDGGALLLGLSDGSRRTITAGDVFPVSA